MLSNQAERYWSSFFCQIGPKDKNKKDVPFLFTVYRWAVTWRDDIGLLENCPKEKSLYENSAHRKNAFKWENSYTKKFDFLKQSSLEFLIKSWRNSQNLKLLKTKLIHLMILRKLGSDSDFYRFFNFWIQCYYACLNQKFDFLGKTSDPDFSSICLYKNKMFVFHKIQGYRSMI